MTIPKTEPWRGKERKEESKIPEAKDTAKKTKGETIDLPARSLKLTSILIDEEIFLFQALGFPQRKIEGLRVALR